MNSQPPKLPIADEWSAILGRIHGDWASRFDGHKAMLRASMMRAFVETLKPGDWSRQDDQMMDFLIHWLAALQIRAGVTEAVMTTETQAATAQTGKPEPPPASDF